MSLWAIVPVKPLRRGKSRLAGVLSEDERTLLNFSMLGHILKTINDVPEIDQKLVVSRDPAALALAREYGARTVQEDGNPHLNTALRRATAVAQAYNTQGVLILPADLPLLQPEDLQELISHAQRSPAVVISPDRRNEGTNALIVNPPGMIEYMFGTDSFTRHCEQARRLNIPLYVCNNANIALDLDLPDDLELVRHIQAGNSETVLAVDR
ncbi:MAG TPA: 2-phospho-L-lactate guanylyltransferase [Anaerolineaceae bacterium]|nr:2-phospho-L-lactate guanylyltransferase [Anaerolineaceae bacterium]